MIERHDDHLPDGTKEFVEKLLDLLYLPEAVFLTAVEFDGSQNLVRGEFFIPKVSTYTRHPVDYVTAEQYTRCFSQLSYVAVGLAIKYGDNKFDGISLEVFKQWMSDCKLFFRKTNLHYRKLSLKGQSFELTMKIKDVRKNRLFLICTLEMGGVVSGELEFAAPF